ncbi:MAG: putative Exonuclease SbcC, partial [Pseudomonadota bacterium]
QPGLPCPVCGSTEHPRAQVSEAVDSMLEALEAHALGCRKALDELLQKQAGESTQQQLATQALVEIDADLSQLADERLAAQDLWDARAPQAGCAGLAPDQREGWLAREQAATQAGLHALELREAVLRQQLREREQARLALDAARAERDLLLQQVQARQQQAALGSQQLQSERQQLARIEQETEALLCQLDAAFPRAAWREQWLADAQDYCQRLRQQVQEWTRARERADALQGGLQGLAQEAVSRQQAQDQASRLEQAQALALQQVETELADYHQQRDELFGGRPAGEVAAALQGDADRSDALQAASLEALQQSRQQQARLLEAQHQTGLRGAQQEAARQQAEQALQRWLEDFNASTAGLEANPALAPADLADLLAIPTENIARERQQLQQIDDAVRQAQAVLADRTATLERHLASREQIEEADVLEQRAAEVAQQFKAAGETQARIKLELAQDDDRLARSAGIRQRIEAQSARTRTWEQLGELIGSADGKKFRNFAQQLTLDLLLGYANEHLQGLTRRYRIERLRDSLGLLVVDQDMGDELRSVHSLSGGESFLVSLALALGLASLSSHRVRVESLFIDEGFGSLDAESLNVAIDALDRLQAMGRKVGVISHVQEMTERIGVRVRVARLSGGASRIVVEGR